MRQNFRSKSLQRAVPSGLDNDARPKRQQVRERVDHQKSTVSFPSVAIKIRPSDEHADQFGKFAAQCEAMHNLFADGTVSDDTNARPARINQWRTL
jgi:hypothetical protein